MQIDLSKMSLPDLKALGFDVIQDLGKLQNDMNMIDQEIKKRMLAPATEATTPTKDGKKA